MNKENSPTSLIFLTFIAILFFALNSILCKVALVSSSIDPYSFTFFRLFSAMITLLLIYCFKHKKLIFNTKKNWVSAFMLFLYAIGFSYAYVNIEAGFGTLLLFGVVQVVMILGSLLHKEKINTTIIFGIVLSIGGLVYLVYPKESFEVSLLNSFFMILAGIAWAVFTILGKRSLDALTNTTDNFIKATLFISLFYIFIPIQSTFLTTNGLLLAIISGSITSALGYFVWYKVLPQMKVLTAGVIQVFVPILAIILSVLFLDELLSFDLILSSVIIISGIAITLQSQNKMNKKKV